MPESKRVPVAAGNWKMNTLPFEGVALCRALAAELAGGGGAEVVVCPPFTHLALARGALAGSHVGLGAQNLSAEPKGAFTGEVSAAMIRELAQYVIIGHSERRQYYGETDELVGRKLQAALGEGLIPIVCVGETLAERDGGQVEAVLTRQVRGALASAAIDARLIVAYEPVWAIGTGRAANGQQANEAMGCIRAEIAKLSTPELAGQIRLLYGGSATPENISEFMAEEHVDGALVGGASLRADSFAAIVKAIAAARAR